LAKFEKNQQQNTRQPEHRLNDLIRVAEVRLVGDAEEFAKMSADLGETLEPRVYFTRDVLRYAEKLGLDLIEVSPNAKPPVCRLMDYKKFLYNQKKREKELKAKQIKVVIKEIRFGPNTDDHDFEFKVKHAINFLEEGSKVKAYVQFRGRSIVFKNRGAELLERFLAQLVEYGEPEYAPKMEERKMHCTITPKKIIKKKKDAAAAAALTQEHKEEEVVEDTNTNDAAE
jgi:translation initiation factor IF-3